MRGRQGRKQNLKFTEKVRTNHGAQIVTNTRTEEWQAQCEMAVPKVSTDTKAQHETSNHAATTYATGRKRTLNLDVNEVEPQQYRN